MTPPRPDQVVLAQRRLTLALAQEGRQWPALCAAVLVTRGGLGLDIASFARVLGVSEATATQLEQGGCAPLLAPQALARLEPALDWAAIGLPVMTEPRHEAATRHPAASHR